MRIIIVPIRIMAVIGGDDRHLVFLREFKQHLVDRLLLFDMMTLQFDDIIVPEKFQPPLKFFFRRRLVFMQDGLRHMSAVWRVVAISPS